MTELEQLIKEWNDFISFKQKETGLTTEYKLIQLSGKYSVGLKEHDSSADNNKVEHSINQEQMMFQIEDMVAVYLNRILTGIKDGETEDLVDSSFDKFRQGLKDCFEYYFKVDFKPLNVSSEQCATDEELLSKIESLAVDYAHYISSGKCSKENMKTFYSFETLQKDLKSLFQTHRNTVSKPVKQQDDNLVDEDELKSKIESLLDDLTIENLNDFDEIPNRVICCKEETTEELLELFKTYQNSVLRPVNNSDEQSIVK
jgi:hypothetical protein